MSSHHRTSWWFPASLVAGTLSRATGPEHRPSQRQFSIEEGCKQNQERPFPAPARRAALRVRAEIRHLRPGDSDTRRFSKTLTDPLVCETVERAHRSQADSQSPDRPPLTLAIGVWSPTIWPLCSRAARWLSPCRGEQSSLFPWRSCAKKELNGVHRFGFEVRCAAPPDRRKERVGAASPATERAALQSSFARLLNGGMPRRSRSSPGTARTFADSGIPRGPVRRRGRRRRGAGADAEEEAGIEAALESYRQGRVVDAKRAREIIDAALGR